MTVREQILEVLSNQLGTPYDKITDDKHIVNDLGADSLDVIEIAIEIEEEVDIRLPDDEARSVTTVGELIKLVEQKVQTQC